MVIYFLKAKSEAIIFFKQLYALIQQELHIDIQRIRTDQGGEFKNHQFQEFTQDKGILHEFSAPYASEQNGFIERSNRTIVEATRAMLHSRDLPLTLWAEAANTAVFVWNRTVNKQLTNVTPFEQLFKQVPDVSFFRIFGSDAYLHVPKKHRTKLDPKSQKLTLVGYDQKGRAYRLWNPITKRICIGVDVIINETLGFHTTNMSNPIQPSSDDTNIHISSSHHTSVISVPTDNIPTSSEGPSVSLPQMSDDSHHIQNNNIFSPIHSEHDAYSDTNEMHEALQEGEIVPI